MSHLLEDFHKHFQTRLSLARSSKQKQTFANNDTVLALLNYKIPASLLD